jgi:hypothetical protein
MAQNRFVFAQRDVDDYSCIKITEGPYKDIIYTYGHVKFASEENERGELPLKFDYDIKKNPNDVDTTSEDFKHYIGDILIEVVEKQLENGTIKFEK